MRFNKDVEYALVALTRLSDGAVYSASRLAAESGLPYKLLCKILQKLNQASILGSQQGAQGGYWLIREPSQLTLQEIVTALHEETRIITCDTTGSCSLSVYCTVRPGMQGLQTVWDTLLGHITLSSFLKIDRDNARQVLIQALS